MNKKILGIIGGGQLGMFIYIAAKIGVKTVVYSNEENFRQNLVTNILLAILIMCYK